MSFTQARITDSLRIDSLKKILPSLKDTARINCLNMLCEAYEYFTPAGGVKEMTDNVSTYASQAENESMKIGYKKGQAYSLLHLAWVKKTNKNFTAAENNVKEAKVLAEQIQDERILGWAYYFLADIPNDKSTYEETLNNYKSAQLHFQKSGDEDLEAEVTSWLCANYNGVGNYEVAIDYCQRSYLLAQKKKSRYADWANWLAQYSLTNMAELYRTAGDYSGALEYYRKGFLFAKENNMKWNMEGEMGLLYERIGKSDSALFYLQKLVLSSDTARMWTKSHQ